MKDNYRDTERELAGAGPFFGRLLISLIFILSGVMKIIFFEGTTQSLKGIGFTFATPAITVLALSLEIVGGLMVLLGWFTRIGAILLMIFLLPATLFFHKFWQLEGHEQSNQMAHFLKNLTIYGGLLLITSFGPGRWSLDACRCKKK